MAFAGSQEELISEAGYTLTEKRSGVYSIMGTAVHKGNEMMLRNKILTGELLPINESIEHAMNEFNSIISESEDIIYDDATPKREHAEKQVQQQVKIYMRDIAPRLCFPENANPDDHLEVYLEVTVDGFLVSGNIDVITILSIADTKSGKKITNHVPQMGMYANLAKTVLNWVPDHLVINHIPRTPVDTLYKGTTNKTYDVSFSMKESYSVLKQFIRDIKEFQQSGNPEVFQANPNCMLCNPKYCKAYGTKFCGYHK